MHTLGQYLLTLEDPEGLTRTLGPVTPCRDAAGKLLFSAGNSAVVFRILHRGRLRSLRCYLRQMRHLREIYGERLLARELYLFTSPDSGEWVDVVLGDWIEGVTLQQAIVEAAQTRDRERMAALSESFDRLAAEMVADEWAHGDLKPENIIVAPDGTLHLIDLDATFLPAFAGEPSPELGTAAYQHPARTAADFDASLDDFPAALIATALHVLRLDPALYDRYREADGLLFTPGNIRSDPALREALACFEAHGSAAWYRIAQAMCAHTLRLFGLAELLRYAVSSHKARADEPELFVSGGRWGYRTEELVVIPPLYDSGFEFSEGLAAVRLGRTWHYIDTAGRTVLSCPGCEAVKPFRGGRAQVVRDGRRLEIDRAGREFDILPQIAIFAKD